METIGLTAAGVILTGCVLASAFERADLSKLLAVTAGLYTALYALAAGVLLWQEKFQINRTLLLLLVLMIIAEGWMLRRKRYPSVSFSWKNLLIPLLITACVLPVAGQKFDLFGMGQDEGVYQIKAVAMMQGYESSVYHLTAMEPLNQMQQREYQDSISLHSLGFNFSDNTTAIATTGVFHGVATYPAVLAWWGTLFGVANMLSLQTLLLAVSIFLLYHTARQLHLRVWGATAVTLLYAVSPLLLWTNKTSLSENILVPLFLLFLTLFTWQTQEKEAAAISWIPLAAYAFCHITVFVVMPVFFLLYLTAYLMRGKWQYLAAGLLSVTAYLCSYQMMMATAEEYTTDNYAFISRIGLHADQMKLYLCMAVAAALICSVAAVLLRGKKNTVRETICLSKGAEIVAGILVRLLTVALLYLAYRRLHSVQTQVPVTLSNATLYGYAAATGWILFAVGLLILLWRPQLLWKNDRMLYFGFLYFYIVLLYSAAFSFFIDHYYYYARYLVPFLPVVLLFGAMMLHELTEQLLPARAGLAQRIVLAVSVLAALALFYRPDRFLMDYRDTSRIDWQTVESLAQQFHKGDAVVVADDIQSEVFFYLDILTDADIYPVMSGNADNTEQIAAQTHDHVYLVTASAEDGAPESGKAGLIGLELRTDGLLDLNIDRSRLQLQDTLFTEVAGYEEVYSCKAGELPFASEWNAYHYFLQVWQVTQ